MSINNLDLNDVLERARRMDSDVLAQIHDRFYPDVYRYAHYRLEDEQICEDIAAEVFLRFLDALHKRRGPNQNIRGWLLGTASNLVNDHLRRRYSRPVENLDDFEEHTIQEDSIESSAESAWEQEQVRQALRHLSLEQQHVLTLRFAEDRSLEETARIAGKSVTAVKAMQFRALAALRRLLSLEEREKK